MLKYIAKRLLYVLFIAFIISMVLFFIFKQIPGDMSLFLVDPEIALKNPELYEQLLADARASLGYGQPIVTQYIRWLGTVLQGNLGYSVINSLKVTEYVKDPIRNTVYLNIFVLVFVFIIAVPLGIISAVKRYTTFDNGVQIGTIIGISVPSFFIALIAIFIFSVNLGWFPTGGMQSPGFSGTGWALFVHRIPYIILPVSVMTFASLAGITRYIRGAMIDVLTKDYIRTARSKGLANRVVILSHAFRNALIPVVTIMTWWIIGIFGGSVIIESIFRWNGIGQLLIQALRQGDYTVMMGMNMFYAILSLVGNVVMDIGYMIVDPRVKLT